MNDVIVSHIQSDPVQVVVENPGIRVTSLPIQRVTRVTESLIRISGSSTFNVIVSPVFESINVTGIPPVYPKVIKAGVQGPQGLPGLGSSNYKSNIEPIGVKDGSNLIFTFPDDPLDPTFELYVNGLLEDPLNYTLAGNQLTLTTAPRSWWRLSACYFI